MVKMNINLKKIKKIEDGIEYCLQMVYTVEEDSCSESIQWVETNESKSKRLSEGKDYVVLFI
jgi:hypothetical protein